MKPSNPVSGPYWPEPITVVSQTNSPYGFIAIEACGSETGRHYTTILPEDQWETLQKPADRVPSFDADPARFRLALEAERLRLAYSCDPLLAINCSRVHVLPHQIEAVYGLMLPQPTIRHLMAHDAGAGKTVMAGLLYKELRMRQPGLRTLIVVPAALRRQWQRELLERFSEPFTIVDRDEITANPGVWSDSPRLITSITFASQVEVRASLANVTWDLVIVDEAHHMAGYADHETRAYRLGELLSRRCRHLVLATATPHKGDPVNFLRLLQLLDAGIGDPSVARQRAEQRGSPLMLRRLKEEMITFDGQPVFKPRVVETRWHLVGDNPPEMALYTALTEYVSKTYQAAAKIGGRERVNVQFAMTLLQRRMNSSLAALERSLERRRKALLGAPPEPGEIHVPEEFAQLPESERWQAEDLAELATAARTVEARKREAHEIEALLARIGGVRSSGIETKVAAFEKILKEAGVEPDNGEKLLVFTEFRDTLDFLRALLEQRGFAVTQIHGLIPYEQRLAAEDEFHWRAQVMVATEAAGEGINLQFCAHMVNYDLPWVPTRLEQRMGRIHRYGQERVAHVYNLSAGDTREGQVLIGLMRRLDEMRQVLGDQVFDVVSTVLSDVDLEQLLTNVALAAPTEPAQDEALRALIAATKEGADRYRQWEEHPFGIDLPRFADMQAASRQFRLTPEYAQHFFVGALQQLKEKPVSLAGDGLSPGDADAIAVNVTRPAVAHALQTPIGRSRRFSFRRAVCEASPGVEYVALGTAPLEGMLSLAATRWGELLRRGTVFLDPALAPGGAYLLWFLAARAFDGNGQAVEETLLAVHQTADAMASATPSALIDLVPAPEPSVLPQALHALARDPAPVITWSIRAQQLPYLSRAQAARQAVVSLRREPVMADVRAVLDNAQRTYSEVVFGEGAGVAEAEAAVEIAKRRLEELDLAFQREVACSLSATRVVGVAAVLAATAEPAEDLPDLDPKVAAAAEAIARRYELDHGRVVTDVTGEHRQYPYDLHSTGPGGPRCIEVKGTSTGRITLSENERRAAGRLGLSYYLYIVRDPLGSPHLWIVQNPLAKMQHDGTVYSGVRYVYNAATWHAAADPEIAI